MEKKSIVSISKFEVISENPAFTVAKAYVCAEDKNRNYSYISHGAIVNAIPSIYNIPVVAHLFKDKEGKYHVGGHDYEIKREADGTLVYQPVTVPFGVVPERDTLQFEEVDEPGRGLHTYLTCEVILWTGRFPELAEAYIGEDKYFGQSMEIVVEDYRDYEEDPNYTEITSFLFDALCLLGEGVEPCFPEAKVTPFSADDENFAKLFTEFKHEIAEFNGLDNNEEGGKKMEDVTTNTAVVDEEFEGENQEPEASAQPEGEPAPEPEAEPEAQPEEEPEPEAAGEGEPEEAPADEQDEQSGEEEFSTERPAEAYTFRELSDALCEAFGGCEDIFADDGRWIAFVERSIVDFTDSEVIYRQEEFWADEGWKPAHYYRCGYAYDEQTHTASKTSDSIEVFCRYLSSDEIARLEADAAAFAALKEFKAEYDRKATEASYDEALEEFSDLVGIDAYQSVYENRYSYESVDALKDACYLIRGKFALQTKPTGKANVDDKIPAITIDQNGKPEVFEVLSPIEKLHKEYGTKKRKQ